MASPIKQIEVKSAPSTEDAGTLSNSGTIATKKVTLKIARPKAGGGGGGGSSPNSSLKRAPSQDTSAASSSSRKEPIEQQHQDQQQHLQPKQIVVVAAAPKQIIVQSANPLSSSSAGNSKKPETDDDDDDNMQTQQSSSKTRAVNPSQQITVSKPVKFKGNPKKKKAAAAPGTATKSRELPEEEKKTDEQLESEAKQIFKGEAFAFSGCQDAQESADVKDAQASFGLKPVDEASKGGGAMTNSLVSTLRENSDISFGDLIVKMRIVLKEKKYSQIPQLQCSHQVDLKEMKFSLVSPHATEGSIKRALLVGCNYPGQDAELNGCINDVKTMREFLRSQGWEVDDPKFCRVLTDDPAGYGEAKSTGKNVLEGMQWLVKDAKPGDSFYLHLSGHGVSLPCYNEPGSPNREIDGMDEAYAPTDFDENGFIRDDIIFATIVAPLPEGARIVCTIDTCHSGSMVDLPFTFEATDFNVKQYLDGAYVKLLSNAQFSYDYAKDLTLKVWNKVFDFSKGAVGDMKETVLRWKDIAAAEAKKMEGRCHKFWCCCCS